MNMAPLQTKTITGVPCEIHPGCRIRPTEEAMTWIQNQRFHTGSHFMEFGGGPEDPAVQRLMAKANATLAQNDVNNIAQAPMGQDTLPWRLRIPAMVTERSIGVRPQQMLQLGESQDKEASMTATVVGLHKVDDSPAHAALPTSKPGAGGSHAPGQRLHTTTSGRPTTT